MTAVELWSGHDGRRAADVEACLDRLTGVEAP